MVQEIMTFFGQTNGTTTTGTFSLQSDLTSSPVTYIQIPGGMRLKIWAKRLSGAPCIVNYQVSHAVPPASPVTISSSDLSSAGELDLEKRRPVVIRGLDGTDALQITWSQTTAAISSVEFEAVFEEVGDDE
jgi:hypothetical protein